MELKDLIQNDLVEFNFGSNALVVKGIFDEIYNGNPVFKITSLGGEKQAFDKELVRNINILLRPAITYDYDYIKDCLREKELEYIDEKIEMLKNNTLEAVFTLPNEIFYPGASVSACLMLFTLGKPHKKADGTVNETFFGYCKEDGFKKKKNLGRIEQFDENNNSKWKVKNLPLIL